MRVRQVALSNFQDALQRARAGALAWAVAVGRTHLSLYSTLGHCYVLFRQAARDPVEFKRICDAEGIVVSQRARDTRALAVIKMVFDSTPSETEARFRYSRWASALLALDEARPRIESAQGAMDWLARVSITRAVDKFRFDRRGVVDKVGLLDIERRRDLRIQEAFTSAKPLARIRPRPGLSILACQGDRVIELDLDPGRARLLLLRLL